MSDRNPAPGRRPATRPDPPGDHKDDQKPATGHPAPARPATPPGHPRAAARRPPAALGRLRRPAGRLVRAASQLRATAGRMAATAGRLRPSTGRLATAARQFRPTAAAPPPVPPFTPGTWRSPLRGQWLTSLLGLVLLIGLPIVAVTGLLSYAAYDPRLPGNDQTPGAPLLKFYLFSWPTHPAWLYRVDQGAHILLGLALVPVVLAKLWSVLPRLFSWPPVRSPAHALERLSLIMVVGGVLFEFATGILNIQNYYVFPFSFYTAHLYGAWVFIAGLVIHVALKFPQMVRGLRSRSLWRELRTPLARTVPEEPDPHGLRAAAPAAPTMSRRTLLAVVTGGSLALVGLTAGESVGGWFRHTALLAPRGLSVRPGTLPVNRTARAAGISAAHVGAGYRLTVTGARTVTLTRGQLLAMPQHTAVLPIACVEGWSYAGAWTGVRLADLADLAGVGRPALARVESLEPHGSFRHASLAGSQVTDPQALLAVRLNGADLPLDHGYPARVIVPNLPGVHNTKWVRAITFVAAT